MDATFLKILICDDVLSTCTYLEDLVTKYATKHNLQIYTEHFYDGEKLLEYLKTHDDVDLIFLDIELPGINGSMVGHCIREELKRENIQIVFISLKEQYAMELFKVRPFDFLIKPLKDDDVFSVLKKYCELYKQSNDFFEYKVAKRYEKISLSEVLYFVCEYRKICIVTLNDKIFFYGKMKDVHGQIKHNDYLSVHNSYIINTKYVKLYRENEVIMINNERIPISLRYKEHVKQKLLLMN